MPSSVGLSNGQLSFDFWDQLLELEERHKRLRSENEAARREFKCSNPRDSERYRAAWQYYCKTTAALAQAVAEFDLLRFEN